MTDILSDNLFWFLKYALLCPLAGLMFNICFFQIAQEVLGVTFTSIKKRKLKCWMYLSFCSLGLALLIRLFS
jgi:hypothetical protein